MDSRGSETYRRSTHSFGRTGHVLVVMMLAALLAACQSDIAITQAEETVETLSVTVSPAIYGSSDLEGQTVRGEIVLSIPAEGWMKEVRFFLNGTLRSTLRSAPFELELDTRTLVDGPHQVGVEARMANGKVRVSNIVHFTVANGLPAGEPAPPETSAPSSTHVGLRGDPGFTPTQLNPQQRMWYDRLQAAISASSARMITYAESDDAYEFGRILYQYNSSLLTALRATGDLRLLDEVDVVAQALRRQLYDGWCGNVESSIYVSARYGTVSSPDGFLNFRRRSSSSRDDCRDVSDLEEALTHGHLAMVMYAYHVNRDLRSPAGVDYGERADFWLDYLRNHFEAKWRGRSNTQWPNMNFMDLKFCHTYSQMTLYYYFVGRRLLSEGDSKASAYLSHASTLTDTMFDLPYVPGSYTGGFVDTQGDYGDAVIFSFGAPSRDQVSSTHLEACPMTYARYAVTSIIALRLENAARWDDAIMTKIANGLNSFVLDSDTITSKSDTVAAGVSGSVTREGMPPTEYRSRLTLGAYRQSLMTGLTAWDGSGRIEKISLEIYKVVEDNPERPTSVHIPSSMLFIETASKLSLGSTASR
jgi:hypothetical protein